MSVQILCHITAMVVFISSTLTDGAWSVIDEFKKRCPQLGLLSSKMHCLPKAAEATKAAYTYEATNADYTRASMTT